MSLLFIVQEDRDEDSQGGNSDDEIAELRIQALLSKRVNEAEVSPARDPPQDVKRHNINKPLPTGRPQGFRPQVRIGDGGRGRERIRCRSNSGKGKGRGRVKDEEGKEGENTKRSGIGEGERY